MKISVAVKHNMAVITGGSRTIRTIFKTVDEICKIIKALSKTPNVVTNSKKVSERCGGKYDETVTADFSEMESYMNENPIPSGKALKEVALSNDPELNRLILAIEVVKLYAESMDTQRIPRIPLWLEEMKKKGIFQDEIIIEDLLAIVEDFMENGVDISMNELLGLYGGNDPVIFRFYVYIALVLHIIQGGENTPPFYRTLIDKNKVNLSFEEIRENVLETTKINPNSL